MKSIKNILGTASMIALALSATSCTDGNDWDVDGSLSRLFGLNGDKITVAGLKRYPFFDYDAPNYDNEENRLFQKYLKSGTE